MKNRWGLLLVLLLSFWAIKPLLQPGFFPIHDDTQVVRVQQMTQALKDGQFPVRWVADLGYGFGYPIFNFYAPLVYYIGALFNLVGFNALLATKMMLMVGILLAGIMMYLLAREFWGEIGGVISGLFYLYAPYHAVDIYVRGAVGEFWAMAFLPLVFYALYKLSQKKEKKWIIVGGLSFAAVILSHNLTAMMTVPFVLLVGLAMLVSSKNKKLYAIRYTLTILFGLGLAAFYWLPALSEMGLTKVLGQIGGGADWRDHFVFLDQLWASPWGFGGSAPGRLDGMSFVIGKIHLLFVFLSLIVGFWFWQKKKKKETAATLIAFCLFVLTIFLTNRLSWQIWETIPLLDFIQYPWRFLIFATLTASFMAGSVISLFEKKPKIALLGGALVIFVLVFFNSKYFQPQLFLDVSLADYINEENIKWETSKISDEYLPRDFPIPQNKNEVAWEKVAVVKGKGEIKNLISKSHQVTFAVTVKDKAEVLVNTAYFPNWKVWLDGEEMDFTLDKGKMKLFLSSGEHSIITRFTDTPVRTLSNLISLISFLCLGLFLFQKRY